MTDIHDAGNAVDRQALLQTMADMQAAHNEQVHGQWQAQGYAYYRAVWVECAELLDHYGWKWWKHQVPDLDQARLELVDIWHFGLSELLRADAMQQVLPAFEALPEESIAGEPERFRLAVEALAEASLATRAFPLDAFVAALAALPMTFTELFELYVGKNVLNRFRQDNGYADGSYRKLWQGREDNEHLMEIVAALPASTPAYPDALYAALAQRYAADTAAASADTA
ncbi:MAG: dUTP diphosphatase [Pseudomonadota bacterium]